MYILTMQVNEYNQEGEYFVEVFKCKPKVSDLQRILKISKEEAEHVLNGGGRIDTEDTWYHLRPKSFYEYENY